LVSLPLGAVVIAALVVGFLGGLAAHLPKRFGAQRRAKRAEKRVAELETQLATARATPALITASGQPTILA
jgi:hypothetical protein